jgi:hypothetical protein
MGPFELFLHLLSFAAPALVVALLVTLLGRWVMPQTSVHGSWWAQFAINFLAGLLALAAGLWWWGVDGKMATYAAVAGAIATSQWLLGRAWRR